MYCQTGHINLICQSYLSYRIVYREGAPRVCSCDFDFDHNLEGLLWGRVNGYCCAGTWKLGWQGPRDAWLKGNISCDNFKRGSYLLRSYFFVYCRRYYWHPCRQVEYHWNSSWCPSNPPQRTSATTATCAPASTRWEDLCFLWLDLKRFSWRMLL